MKFRHLEYFVNAGEELNFPHAAARLNVSQAPLRKQIHDLETELGTELLRRHQKAVALTAVGRVLLLAANSFCKLRWQRLKKPCCGLPQSLFLQFDIGGCISPVRRY
jgi:hypothetical protein